MPLVVAVAGGSSGLGRAIAESLVAVGRYQVLILSRTKNPKLEEATGARVLAADYSNIDSTAKLLQENKVSTVMSTMNAGINNKPDLNLVQAASRAGVKRFIPNLWSALAYTPEHFTYLPFAKLRYEVMDTLRKTDMEWTAIYNGIFLDYYVEALPTHLYTVPICVDVENNAAGIPGSGNTPVAFTYTYDIGKYIAALLGVDKWEQDYRITGGTKTWNEVVAIAEKAKGVKFDVSYDSVEKLETGQITEMRGHQKAYDMFGGKDVAKPMVQNIYARFGLWMEEGQFVYKEGPSLNELFPDIKPLSMEDAWRKVGKNI